MKLAPLLLMITVLGACPAWGQTNDAESKTGTMKITKTPVENPETFVIVEKMPYFSGGDNGLIDYLRQNIRYPDSAIANGISGTVYVQFTVTEIGKVDNVSVLRGIGGGCDEEAVRVVENMPPWRPGTQKGNLVNVVLKLPITFRTSR